MSSNDTLRLLEHAEDGLHEHDDNRKLGTGQGPQAVQSGSTQVRFSSRSPQLTTQANKPTTHGAHPNQVADAVYGDGNVFVTDERVKQARCGCNYVRAIIAILMLPIFVLLILVITGVLPINFGIGTHDDAPVPPAATNSQQHVQEPLIVSTAYPYANQEQYLQRTSAAAVIGSTLQVDLQILTKVQQQVAQAMQDATPEDVQRMMDTALNGALQLLNSAGARVKPESDFVEQLKMQLVKDALREAAKNAVNDAQKNPDALLRNVKNAISNLGNVADLTAAKLSDAIKPGVVGPNDTPQENVVPARPEQVMEDAPINQEEFNRILQNALRRRGSP